MEKHTFNVGRYLVFPGRDIVGFIITAKPEIGVMEEIGRLARQSNVIILYISFSMVSNNIDVIKGIGFVDLTNSRFTVDKIISRLKSIKNIIDVDVINPIVKGFVGDLQHHKLYIGNERTIFLSSSGFRKLVEQLNKFGTGGLAVLYNIGYEIGRGYAESYIKNIRKLGIDLSRDIKERIIEYSLNLNGIGKGKLVKVSLEPFKINLRLYDNFECSVANNVNYQGSHYVRGVIAGIVEELCNKKVLVNEIKCIAKGDPYCEFEIIERK